MSFSVVGRIVDENGSPWTNLTVVLRTRDVIIVQTLDRQTLSNDGRFELLSPSQHLVPDQSYDFILYDSVKRELFRKKIDSSPDTVFNLGTISINRIDGSGFRVTLGKGTHPFMSEGNAVTLLVDNKAFETASGLLKNASESILLSQLFFDLPKSFIDDPQAEKAQMIFKYGSPLPTAQNLPRKLQSDDERPERILIDVAKDKNVDVKILLHKLTLPSFILGGANILFIFLLFLITIFSIALYFIVVSLISPLLIFLESRDAFPFNLDNYISPADDVRKYFSGTNLPNIQIESFPQEIINSGVQHVKMLIVDGKHALNFGPPFNQNYNDAFTHLIDEPRRGSPRDPNPRHDVSFMVTGPAVADMHELMKLLWNTTVGERVLKTISPSQPSTDDKIDADAVSSVQIVRTLTPNRFKILPLPEGETETIAEEMIEIEKMEKLKDGEKGIHEAYLRAIANAEDFIYLENQYFTSDTIGDALIEAMKAKPQLQVIMLLNIKPDLPLAPWKQRRLITRIRKAVPEPPEGQRPRFGVFTRWTHETTADIFPKAKKPRILSIYLHSKVAVVDNKWATIGSANLDGWSLDSSIISDIFRPFFGNQEQRAIEANALMFNGVDGLTSTDIVDKLRRRLWAEHLGYVLESENSIEPDENHNDLKLNSEGHQKNGFLGLWQASARKKLAQLIINPDQSSPNTGHVLRWPDQDCTFSRPSEYLLALGINIKKLTPIKSVRGFLFNEGTWDPSSELENDLFFNDLEDLGSALFREVNDIKSGAGG